MHPPPSCPPSSYIPHLYAGRKLYEAARAGEDIKRLPRPVVVSEFEMWRDVEGGQDVQFRVRCSKGTYIRSLAHDLVRPAYTLIVRGQTHMFKPFVFTSFYHNASLSIIELNKIVISIYGEAEGGGEVIAAGICPGFCWKFSHDFIYP